MNITAIAVEDRLNWFDIKYHPAIVIGGVTYVHSARRSTKKLARVQADGVVKAIQALGVYDYVSAVIAEGYNESGNIR